jgi:hypothetical protein
VFVTDGTYSNGTAIFTNNTGGTFNVSGFSTGTSSTDIYVTGGTYSGQTLTLVRNDNVSIPITGFTNSANGISTYMLVSGATDIAGYNKLVSLNEYIVGPVALITTTITTASTIVGQFVTDIYNPNLTVIPSGEIDLHFEIQKVSGSAYYFTFATLSKLDLIGNETILLSSDTSNQSNLNALLQINLTFSVSSNNIYLNSTDRLVVKIYAKMVTSTGNVTVRIDDNTNSRLSFPSAQVDTSNFIPYSGATRGVDLGVHGLTGTSISATTYQGLPQDIYVTGGTYSGGTTIFTNNTGGTFNVSGFSTNIGFTGFTGSTGLYSIKSNNNTNIVASGDYSFAEGAFTTAIGLASHAEGSYTTAFGSYSHSEGGNTIASGVTSHAEGDNTIANGLSSHAEGSNTRASGDYSHAGGANTIASGLTSFVHGSGSTAGGINTIVLGANITGLTNNTTYVDSFNIKTLGGGSSVNNLGIDSNGNIVVGTSSSNFTGGTIIGATQFTNGLTANTMSATTYFGLPLDVFATGLTLNLSNYDLILTRNDGVSLTTNLGLLSSDVTITGGTYNPNNGVITFSNNTGGTFSVSGFSSGMTDTTITNFTYNNNRFTITDSSGGTFSSNINSVTGLTSNGTISSNILSATTYQGLPLDIKVTGGTYSNGSTIFTNNTGGTFTVNGFYTGFTGGVVSGLTAVTISATTYQNLPLDIKVTGGTYNAGTATFTNNTGGTFTVNGFSTAINFTGGTVTGPTQFTSGLTANTFSASTYLGLPIDIRVTGGTYSNGTATFTNNTGGTFNVSGFSTGGGGGQLFYFNISQSKNSNRYLSTTGSTASEQSTGTTIGVGATETIASFQSDQLNKTLIPGGIWSFYLHSYKENNNAAFNIFVEVYKLTSGGTSTLLFTTDPTPVTTNSPTPSMQLSDAYFSGSPITVTDSIVALVRATNTSNQSHTITFFTEGSQHYSYVVSSLPTQQGLTCDNLSDCSTIQTIKSDILSKLSTSGGTITGNLTVNGSLSASTYLGLPLDIRVTGGTYSNGTATFTNNTGGTFNVSGFSTGGTGTDIYVTGGTLDGQTLTLRRNDNNDVVITGFTTGTTSSDIYWSSGSSGDYSVKIVNDSTTDATGNYAVAAGLNNQSIGIGSFTMGHDNVARDSYNAAFGFSNSVSGITSFAAGNSLDVAAINAAAFGFNNRVTSDGGFAAGYNNIVGGLTSAAFGNGNDISGNDAGVFGNTNIVSGNYSFATGRNNTVTGSDSFSEGKSNTVSGNVSHAEGDQNTSSGLASHAEGSGNIASGDGSHVEGALNTSSGQNSHAGGNLSVASGLNSFVHGSGSTAIGVSTIVLGSNLTGTSDNTTYVDALNIKTIGGNSVSNLGIDVNNFVTVIVNETGTTSVNFGAAISGETSFTTVTVSSTTVTDLSNIVLTIISSTNHPDIEDSMIDGVVLSKSDIVDNVSFNINAFSSEGTWGVYNIKYLILN